MGGKLPERKVFAQVALLLGEDAGDSGEAPVLVWLVELSGLNASGVQQVLAGFESLLVSNRQVEIGGVVVGWATVCVGVLDSSMPGLDGLLREWEIAAGDCVQVRLGCEVDLLLGHDALL